MSIKANSFRRLSVAVPLSFLASKDWTAAEQFWCNYVLHPGKYTSEYQDSQSVTDNFTIGTLAARS